jgi:hypothetical protein
LQIPTSYRKIKLCSRKKIPPIFCGSLKNNSQYFGDPLKGASDSPWFQDLSQQSLFMHEIKFRTPFWNVFFAKYSKFKQNPN